MATISPVLIAQLLELGQAAARVVQDVREHSRTEVVPAAAYERPARAPEPEDVLAAIELDAERVLRGELKARELLRIKRDRAAQEERSATEAAATLARSAPSREAGAADPQAIAYISRAQSLRRDIEVLSAELQSAEAQVALAQEFASSLRRTGDDLRRTVGALRRGYEQTQRLNALTELTERATDLTAMVRELTDHVDAARAEAEAGRVGLLRPDAAMFLAQGRLADAEATDELRRLYEG